MTPFLIATLFALVGVGTLALLYRRGEMRRFRQVLVGGTVAAVLVVSYLGWVSGGKLDRIDAAQVALSDLRMTEAAGSFRLEGRVQNRSAVLTIASVPVRLIVEDCVAGDTGPAGACHVVFDDTAEVTVTVPPGGSNDFRRIYTATTGSARGTRRWHATPGAPRAYDVAPL